MIPDPSTWMAAAPGLWSWNYPEAYYQWHFADRCWADDAEEFDQCAREATTAIGLCGDHYAEIVGGTPHELGSTLVVETTELPQEAHVG